MKKTGLAVFFVLVILLGLLAGQLGIAHLPWSSEDTDTAPGPAVTEQAAEAPARDGEATAPATGTEDAGQEKAPAAPEAAPAADAETDQDAQPAVPLPEGAEIINGEVVVHGTVEKGDTVSKIIEGNTSSGPHLDFRLRQNGKFVNPAKAINPRGESVRKASMDRFRKTVEKERALLLGQTSLLEYDVDSIVPVDDVEPSAK